VKEVVIMGGAVKVNGNVNPIAEANINNDPLAADLVLTANWPVTLIGLDVTLKVLLDDPFMQQVKNKSDNCELLYQISRFYDNFYRTSSKLAGLSCHDATAAIYITNPEVFTTIQGPMRVVCDGIAEGMTILDSNNNYDHCEHPWSNKPKVNVCLDVEPNKIKEILLTHLY
jgi:inosine-uridine nucleoside N-ribohydrolase